MGAVKGSDKEKKLASQFIAKFAKSFPDLENKTIDAMFDLCEDDDVLVSLQILWFALHIQLTDFISRFVSKPSRIL